MALVLYLRRLEFVLSAFLRVKLYRIWFRQTILLHSLKLLEFELMVRLTNLSLRMQELAIFENDVKVAKMFVPTLIRGLCHQRVLRFAKVVFNWAVTTEDTA